MTAFRVLLADLPRREEFYPYSHPTFGLLYLAGSLKRAFAAGDVEVRYLQGNVTLQEHLKYIEEYKPHLYGTSFKTPMARLASTTTKAVRAALPTLPIIAGGVHCTAMPEDVLNHSAVDACFRGECEQSFVDLVANWKGGPYQFEHAAGAVVRRGESYFSNEPQALTKDINTLAWPAWDLVENGDFRGMHYETGPSLGVVVSRGCPWKCTFCSEPIWKINGSPTFRARSPEAVAEEVEYLYQRGIREVRLWCEELNANISWACEALNAIARLGHRDLYLNSNIRADRVTPALADAMKNANMRLVCAGIESASQDTLDAILKQCKREKIELSCGLLKSRGIKVLGYFLLYPAWERDGRLEFEDTRAALNTINYGRQLHRNGLLDYMSVSIATPRPSAPMWDVAAKYKLFRSPMDRPFYYLQEGMALPGIDPGEINRTLLYARAVQSWIALRSGNYRWRQFSDGIRKLVGKRVAA
jgi:radical SAM superfamily enzyme YgiQ (UPF0313 family)